MIEKKESTYDLIANEMESDKEVKVIKKEKVKGDTVDSSVYWFLFKNSGKGFMTFVLFYHNNYIFRLYGNEPCSCRLGITQFGNM